MAEVNVEKKRDETRSPAKQQGQQEHRGWLTPSHRRGATDIFSANPFTMMRRLSEEMDRAFSGAWPDFDGGRTGAWSPAIDVSEHDGQLRVRADLPGINQEDVKVEVTGDTLTIEGERKQEHEEEGKGFYRSERSYGQFCRSIPLPEGAKPEEAHAQFNNGVLEVSVPVPEQQQNRRQIPIDGGSSERKEPKSETAGQKRESKAS